MKIRFHCAKHHSKNARSTGGERVRRQKTLPKPLASVRPTTAYLTRCTTGPRGRDLSGKASDNVTFERKVWWRAPQPTVFASRLVIDKRARSVRRKRSGMFAGQIRMCDWVTMDMSWVCERQRSPLPDLALQGISFRVPFGLLVGCSRDLLTYLPLSTCSQKQNRQGTLPQTDHSGRRISRPRCSRLELHPAPFEESVPSRVPPEVRSCINDPTCVALADVPKHVALLADQLFRVWSRISAILNPVRSRLRAATDTLPATFIVVSLPNFL